MASEDISIVKNQFTNISQILETLNDKSISDPIIIEESDSSKRADKGFKYYDICIKQKQKDGSFIYVSLGSLKSYLNLYGVTTSKQFDKTNFLVKLHDNLENDAQRKFANGFVKLEEAIYEYVKTQCAKKNNIFKKKIDKISRAVLEDRKKQGQHIMFLEIRSVDKESNEIKSHIYDGRSKDKFSEPLCDRDNNKVNMETIKTVVGEGSDAIGSISIQVCQHSQGITIKPNIMEISISAKRPKPRVSSMFEQDELESFGNDKREEANDEDNGADNESNEGGL